MSTIRFVGPRFGALWAAVWLSVLLAAEVAGQPRLEDSSHQAVTFSIDLPEPTWTPGESAWPGEDAWEAQLPGFVSFGSPAQVRLPRHGATLVVPPGTRPRLEVVQEQWRPLDGRRMAVETVPTVVRDPDSGTLSEQPWLPIPGAVLPEDRVPATALADYLNPDLVSASGPAVRLGEVTWWRGRRVVNVTIIPVRADQEGRAARALTSGRWRVRFEADDAAGKDLPAGVLKRLTSKGDQRFAGHFLNGELLAGLPTEAAARGIMPDGKARAVRVGTPLGYPEVKLRVNRTQLMRVRRSELVAAGLLPDGATIRPDQLRLYQRHYAADLDDPTSDPAPPYVEVEVPIHVVGSGEEFDGDDLFLFWGLRPADDGAFSYERDGVVYQLAGSGDLQELYNEYNIYWLQLADPDQERPWARMQSVDLPPSSGAPLQTYRRIDRQDEAVAYRENVYSRITDRYVYNSLLAQNATVPLNLWSPQLDQVGAVLRASMGNFGSSTRVMAVELVQGEEVVAPLSDFNLPGGQVDRIFSDAIPPSALGVENLSVRIRRSSAAQIPMFAFVDWVEVDYRAEYTGRYGRLRFPGGDVQDPVGNLELAGFPDAPLGLIEVTDPRNPRLVTLTGQNLYAEGEGLTLSLQVDQSAGQRQFYAATRMFTNGVSDVDYNRAAAVDDATPPTQLSEGAADVLVVTHPEFSEQVAQWVQYRRSRDPGLTFHVVEPEQLYDWYSGGLRSPWAIKRLVNHALESPTWGTWALLLVGDANENPRELGVASSGRQWSKDWVPTHFHIQNVGQGLPPEVLGSDKWFGNPAAGDEETFPGGSNITAMPALYIGRIPCNSPDDFARVLTKIQQVESDDGQAWRRRGIFMSDDAWSTGSLDTGAGFNVVYRASERAFEQSENQVLAQRWANNAGMVQLVADTVMLRPFMEPLHPELDDTVSLSEAREFCAQSGATESLANALSAGGTLAHFQGHANHYVMTHENWFFDRRGNLSGFDVDLLTNVGRPWVFFGMGCHLGDFIQNVAGPNGNTEPGLGEKFLFYTDGGAVATYASSGFEFLSTNKTLSEVFLEVMAISPPAVAADGEGMGTRWMLGELKWQAESNMLSISQSSTVRAMVYQYVILGDPLLLLDAGAPEVDAELVGTGPLPVEAELVAIDASNQRVIEMQARDEAGIDRLRVRDSQGNDLTASAVLATPFYDDGRTHIMDYVITLPVRPFPHDIVIDIYDAADRLDTDHHPSFTLSVAHEWTTTLTADGTELDPRSYVMQPGEPVDLVVSVNTAAWIDDETVIELQGDNVEVSGESWLVRDNAQLEVSFTATAPAAKADRGVRLLIDGWETYVELETSDVNPASGGVTGLVNFPNPMRDGTRFVFGTNVLSGTGKVRVWTVSGRSVAEVPFTLVGSGQEMVAWGGVDRQGDRLANGTYLYRVELDGPLGLVRSDMQRLVIMR